MSWQSVCEFQKVRFLFTFLRSLAAGFWLTTCCCPFLGVWTTVSPHARFAAPIAHP